MNQYTFDELYVGLEDEFKHTVTEEDHSMFKKLSGDISPLHVDKVYAMEKGFDECIAYGMFTTALLSRLVGVFLPGAHGMCQGLNVAFVKPVYIGDTLKVHDVIKETHELFRQIVVKVTVTNQNDIKVLRGTVTVGVL